MGFSPFSCPILAHHQPYLSQRMTKAHLSRDKSSSFARQKLTFCTVIAHLLNGKIYLIENQGLIINGSFRRFLGRISPPRLTNASSPFCHQRHFCYCLMAIQFVDRPLKIWRATQRKNGSKDTDKRMRAVGKPSAHQFVVSTRSNERLGKHDRLAIKNN